MILVTVDWRDIFSSTGHWTDKHFIPNPEISGIKTAQACSSGVLLHEDENNVTVCTNLSGEQYSQVITIPKGCIKHMWKLKVEKEIPVYVDKPRM